MTTFVEVCALSDVPVGGVVAVDIDGLEVAIVRSGEDEVFAIRDECSHASIALSEGDIDAEACEIEGAGHASTTGRFDDQQLFYLQSRGIHEDEARRLVVHGFFADLITKISVPEVRERLLAGVRAELAKNVGSTSTAVGA